jgi:hypothetical protein
MSSTGTLTEEVRGRVKAGEQSNGGYLGYEESYSAFGYIYHCYLKMESKIIYAYEFPI